MAHEDEFKPRLGRMRARASKGRKYLHQVLAAANLARGGVGRRGAGGFTGSRTGRGVGAGRVLASRDRFAAHRQRRVIIKSRIVKLAGTGLAGAQAHLRYIQRDGTTREGAPGSFYDAEIDCADGKAFLARGVDERHQFRFIVSAEDGVEYEDLKPLTRRLMNRMAEDLGTRLDWVAVDHFNTGHPHTHIILRGKDERGRDLIIARDYMTHGMRERAAEIVRLDLGPRSDSEIEGRLRAEVGQERLTSIDRRLIRDVDAEGIVGAAGRDAFDQTLRMGRLRKLARLGLATELGQGRWHLADGFDTTLMRMGERGDIIKTMHRDLAARGIDRAASDRAIFEPGSAGKPIVGRLMMRGLSDEASDRHYVIVDGVDGRSHYIDIGKGETQEPIAEDAIVRITPRVIGARPADRAIAEIAAANGGRYSIDIHLQHDRSASEAFAQAHVRRLEAIRRVTGDVERQPNGTWIIGPDHVERAVAHEARSARDRPVTIETLSPLPPDRLAKHDGATWLDRELIADTPEPVRDAGFGRDVRAAQAVRRQWLIEQELAEDSGGRTTYRANMFALLQRRELLRVAGPLSEELGLEFVEAKRGERIDGTLRRRIDLVSGRFALVEKAKQFTLVPWRPILDRRLGKPVAGIMRGNGVSWMIGRQRSGPTIL